MKDWLKGVGKMAMLNGIGDFRFTEANVEVIAYAYHVDFSPIEAVALWRLVANRTGEDDPCVAQEIEGRARDLMLIARPDEVYDTDALHGHVARFLALSAMRARQFAAGRPGAGGSASPSAGEWARASA